MLSLQVVPKNSLYLIKL